MSYKNIIKNNIARLFNLHNTKRFYQMKDCLRYIYNNYYKFRKYVEQGEAVDENFIFNRLNARTLQIFPQIAYEEELYFHTMIHTLKKCDFWATITNMETGEPEYVKLNDLKLFLAYFPSNDLDKFTLAFVLA